jgi:zinc protease
MRSRVPGGLGLLVVVAGAWLAPGCSVKPRPTTWGPLGPGTNIGAMASTIVPEAELGLDLPRFAVAQRQLESGLRLGVESSSARGQIAAVLTIAAGAADDPPDHEGLAHLVEHLVYHARGNGGPSLSDRLLRLGARYNADTSLDVTRFHEVAPASALPALLALTGERLSHPLAGVDEADFERERAIVENEINQRTEIGVVGMVTAWIQRSLYPSGHPYSRPIGGSATSLRRLTLADARRFVATHYRADNATLLVTGEVGGQTPLASVSALLPSSVTARGPDRGRGRALVPAAFGPAARPERTQVAEDAHDTMQAPVATPQIWIAWNLGGDAEAESAVNKILVAPAAAAMVRDRLRGEPGVRAVTFHPIEVRHATWLACEIDVEGDSRRADIARKARNLVWATWSDSGPPAAVDWEGWRMGAVLDIRRAALTGSVLGAEAFLDRALDRAQSFQVTGEVAAYDRMLTRIANARLADVSNRAFDLLAPERARTLFVDPITSGDGRAPGAVGVRGAEGAFVKAGARRAADFKPPPPLPAPAGLDHTRMVTLPNGMAVLLVPRPQFPSVTALLGFYGGRAALPGGVLELVRIVEPRGEGAGRATALEIEGFDGPGWSADYIRTDRRHLSNALFLLADRLKAIADTNWAGLLMRARERPAGRSAIREDPRNVALAGVIRSLYGNHPFARDIDLDDILALDPGAPSQWLPHLYNPRNAVLIIVGDIDPGNAANLAAGWFAGWSGLPGTGRLATPPAPPAGQRRNPRDRETVIVTHRPVTTQVELRYACRLAPVVDPRAQAAQRMLAGLLGAELTGLIREEAGAAYSVDARVAALAGGGAHLEISMAVDSRRLKGAIATLRSVLDATGAGQVDAASLSQVRSSLTRELGLRDLTGQDLALDLFRAMSLGFSPAVLGSEAEQIARATPEDVSRAFIPCRGHAVMSLVGDQVIIRSAL